MNSRALSKVVKEARDIASWACGRPVSATLNHEVKAYNWAWSGVQDVCDEYTLWIIGEEAHHFTGSWEETLSFVEWLKDVEVPVKYLNR